MQSAAAGNAAACNAFSQHFGPIVHRWLHTRWSRTPLRSFVDDAVQEVLIECLRPSGALQHVDRERASHGFEAFLHGITNNVACRIERTEARAHGQRRRIAERSTHRRPTNVAIPAQLDRSWLLAKMRAALRQLRSIAPRHGHTLHEFLQLHFEGNLPVRTIAEQWHEPVERIHELRRQACRRFRECLLHHVHADPPHTDEVGAELLEMIG